MRLTRILLADDDHEHQMLLLAAIGDGRPDVSVTPVSNRDELLAAASKHRYDCIVLDFNLPPYTATELIREITPIQQGVPYIVVSCSEEQAVVIDSIRNGVADFIKKEEAIAGSYLWDRINSIVTATRSSLKERRQVNRRIRQLQAHANTDALTGLMNRRGLESAMSVQSRGGNRRKNTAAILIDLDHFKRVNDSFGHDTGDRVLKQAASVLQEQASPTDLVARWGGEEFLVLRQSTSLADAWMWAEGVRDAIRQNVTLPKGLQTASFGVDLLPSAELSPDELVRADRAMYLAKDSGRDRVCTWQMVEAMDAALDLGCRTELTVRGRLQALIDAVQGGLGPTQRDHTGGHGLLVRELAASVAKRLIEDESDREHLTLAAEFHDIGKIVVPEDLLALPRRLSENERRFVNEHAWFGAELLRAIGAPDRAAEAIARHHDSYGISPHAGPEKRIEEPKLADVLTVCDAAIAMLSTRPYAEAISVQQAMAELRAGSGAQFHPEVVADIHFVDWDGINAA